MLKEQILHVLNKQFNYENYSAYLYLAMSSYCDLKGFKGFANWLYIQAQEELAHGMNIYKFILERGGQVEFVDIKSPKAEYGSFEELFAEVLSHEQWITEQVNHVSTVAMQANDHGTYSFMQWYIAEQIEEESSASLILQKVKYIGENKALLIALDNELATRVFVNPFPEK